MHWLAKEWNESQVIKSALKFESKFDLLQFTRETLTIVSWIIIIQSVLTQHH